MDFQLPTDAFVAPHSHSGDTPQLDPRTALKGFPIISAVPTDTAPEGTIRIYSLSGTYRIYVRVNKAWHYAALT